MKTPKIVLTVLCAAACAWFAKMLVGVVGLSRDQEVSAPATVFELSMFLGASLLPLIAVWLFDERKRKWLYILWAPCVLYVGFLAINFARFSPLAGVARILLWSAIIVLFISESKKTKTA